MWICSPELKLSLLLKDSDQSILDRHSYFNFLEVHYQPGVQPCNNEAKLNKSVDMQTIAFRRQTTNDKIEAEEEN